MSSYAFFQMWEPFRRSLIARHVFYIEQARKRLLSQFENIEAEADLAAEHWLDQNRIRFDPDRHDPGDFYESANDAGIEFYQLLTDMREQTRLSIVAGMFHEWDKQVRDWLVREIQHWHRGETVKVSVWKADFLMIADFLESLGWKIRASQYFNTLDACRLVVNVYKHGDGKSFEDLKQNHPTYLDNGFSQIDGTQFGMDFLDHTHLAVSDTQLDNFSNAIIQFWEDVPQNIYDSKNSLPNWFEKAIMKDRA